MQTNWLFFMDPDWGSPYMFTVDSMGPQPFGSHLWSQLSSFLDNSLYTSRCLFVPESLVLEEALNCISVATGSILFWFSGGSKRNIAGKLSGNSHTSDPRSLKNPQQVKHKTASRHDHAGFSFGSSSKGKSGNRKIFGKILSFTRRQLLNAAEELLSFALLSLPSAGVLPLNNLSTTAVGVPLESTDMRIQRCMNESPCDIERHGCADLSLPDRNWARHAVEPRTGIKFPKLLDNILAGGKSINKMSEVLVGTGSRTMKIIKIKSLKVYAFGFYVDPYDVCAKLGPKYASIVAGEVNKCHDFYRDLLREDISMTVRLVVNCNGMKINTVRESFEKSLRARLLKTNPDTDFNCLGAFGSLFAQDIPLHAGTTIDFRQTADGHLITEIGGSQIGAVHSKELCTAFFDMYIGDLPVSEQAKEEIGRNVAHIIRRC